MHKRALVLTGVLLAVALATSLASATAIVGEPNSKASNSLWAVSALTLASTALPDVPAGVHAPSPAEQPEVGTVHQLGNGKAFAWTRGDEICWNSGPVSGVGGCGRWSDRAFDVAVHPVVDPWPADPAQPAHIFGIAVDGVTEVVATLKDGSTHSTAPNENWYDIELPADVRPWELSRVTATMADGTTQFYAISLRPPSERRLVPPTN